jgi:hypothetical protein
MLNSPCIVRTPACAAGLVLVLVLGAAPRLSRAAAPIVLDNFSTPAMQANLLTDKQDYVTTDIGTFAGEVGQIRSGYYYHYWPTITTATGSAATLGVGGASVAAAQGEIGELALGYGSLAQGGGENGRPLGLDLSRHDDLQVQFADLGGPINLLVGFYTAVPGADATYYWNGEATYVPAHPGGPATVDILFKGRDQYQSGSPPVFSDPSLHDFAEVDGVVLIVDRAAQSDGNHYTITGLDFTTAPVPEPPQWAMSLAAAALLGLVARKHRARRLAP